ERLDLGHGLALLSGGQRLERETPGADAPQQLAQLVPLPTQLALGFLHGAGPYQRGRGPRTGPLPRGDPVFRSAVVAGADDLPIFIVVRDHFHFHPSTGKQARARAAAPPASPPPHGPPHPTWAATATTSAGTSCGSPATSSPMAP